MDPTHTEVPPDAYALPDTGDHVRHGADTFTVRRIHLDKKMERDRLGHERTVFHYSLDAIVGDPAFSDGDELVGDLL